MIPTTAADLLKIAPKAKRALVAALAEHADAVLAEHEINATARRLAHFWAQAAHETAGLKTLVEYASGDAYEGRLDLGNIVKGDGRRFKGRGIFQLTGRANYARFGDLLGIDLVKKPALAADPLVSLRTAALYWSDRKLSPFADKDQLQPITRRINGGLNGLADRRIYLIRAKGVFGVTSGPAA